MSRLFSHPVVEGFHSLPLLFVTLTGAKTTGPLFCVMIPNLCSSACPFMLQPRLRITGRSPTEGLGVPCRTPWEGTWHRFPPEQVMSHMTVTWLSCCQGSAVKVPFFPEKQVVCVLWLCKYLVPNKLSPRGESDTSTGVADGVFQLYLPSAFVTVSILQ